MKINNAAARLLLSAAVLSAALAGSACGPGAADRPRLSLPSADTRIRTAEADGWLRRGHYAGFKRASAILSDIYKRPDRPADAASLYVRALTLLRIRECQIGILFTDTAEEARRVIGENPGLRRLAAAVDMADALSALRPSRGIQTDVNPVRVTRDVEDAKPLKAELKARAAGEECAAYLYVTFFASLGAWSSEPKEDCAPIYALFPESRLMLYANAVRSGQEKPEILNRLAAADPEFFEAYFHLGESALAERNLLSAEKYFLLALPGLDGSPQESIYLASIYTATEEFERSLEFYDRTLALSPGYRDALLGKAICLSYLGRYDEAQVPLNRMIELGNWMLGECHYWMAWNKHALKDGEAAQAHIEQSKGRLPTNSEVFGLAGTIALEKNQVERAEKEFKEALRCNAANIEALFGLGRIGDQGRRWLDAAGWYEQAAAALGRNEAALLGRIEQIKSAALGPERRAVMLAKKEEQLRTTRATLALACFNAAAAWFNTGLKERALPWAEKSAAHPQFRDKALALLLRIKG